MNTKTYKTKTDIIARNNGSVKDAWLCAVDYGYSSVKIFSQNTIAVYPSYAKRFDGDIVGSPPPEHIVYRDLDTNERWLVGEAAQNDVRQDDATISEEAVFGRARYDDPMFLVLVRTGLGLGCRKNEYGNPLGKTVYVQSGLPPKYMKMDTPKLTDVIAGRHRFALKVGSAPERMFDITVQRRNISIMEQPKGTLYSIAKDNSHRFVPESPDYFNKNLIVFDAGFGTLDIFPIRNNHVVDKQTFPEYSMREVLKQTIAGIYDAYGTDVSLIGLQKCLGDGYVKCHDKFSSKNKPFGDILEASSRKVCDDAMERLGQILPLYEYDYLVITGGTGAAWDDQIREKLKEIDGLKIVDGNQNDTDLPFMFANVRGYYMYLYDRTLKASK